ncbi:MAG: hypothetical protein IPN96_19615 [Anaerolineales bacterium]|nr:hypothetical protein [Anaerolineales bacterium]
MNINPQLWILTLWHSPAKLRIIRILFPADNCSTLTATLTPGSTLPSSTATLPPTVTFSRRRALIVC